MPFFSFFKQKKSKGKEAGHGSKAPKEKRGKKPHEIRQSASKDVQKEKEKEKKERKSASVHLTFHTTEKSTGLSERGVYTFKVDPRFNKIMIKNEIKKVYGVDPVRVNISNKHKRKKAGRGNRGVRPGFKKAMVLLKEGDKINE